MARTVKLFIDISQGILLAGINNPVPARTPRFVQGDNPTVEVHLVDTSAGTQLSPAPEVAFDDTAVIKIAIGKPGDVVAAFAELSTSLPGHLGRSGALNLNTTEIAALLGTAATVTTTLELQDTSGTSVDTPLQVPVIVSKELITDDSTPPTSFVSDIAALKAEAEGYAALAETAKVSAQTSAGQAAAAAGAADTSKTNAENSATAAEAARIQAEASAAAAGNADKLGKGDARVQALGGVSLRGDTGTGSGLGCTSATPTLSDEFEIVACVRRTSSDATMRHLACIQTSGGHINVCFGAATSGGTPMLGWGGNYEVTVPNPTDWHWVSFGHDALGWFFTLDGVLTRSASLTGQTPVAINRVFAGDSGVGQFAGDVPRSILFNFALSESQRAKLLLNEPGADILGRGRSLMPEITGWVSQTGGDLVLSNVTATGFSAVSAAGSYSRADTTTTIGDVPSSRRLRAKVTLAGASAGGAPTLQRVIGSNLSQFPYYVQLSNGTAFYELPEFVGFDRFALSLVQHPAYGNAAASSYTFTLESLEVLGASGRWEPLNVTLLPRWLDSSGNGNDLIPATTNSGLTPLNPQPATTRVQGFSVNTAASVDPAAAGPLYTVTKSGTGTLVFTPKPILGTRPNWVASNAATGQDTVTSSLQTNGVNTVQAHRNNVVVDDTIEGVIAHIE